MGYQVFTSVGGHKMGALEVNDTVRAANRFAGVSGQNWYFFGKCKEKSSFDGCLFMGERGSTAYFLDTIIERFNCFCVAGHGTQAQK